MTHTHSGPVLLYDGHCPLCQRSVQWVLRHDRQGRVRFAPLQSHWAQRQLAHAPSPPPDSLVLLENGQVYYRTQAIRRLLRHLDPPWSCLRWVLYALPLPLIDRIYDFVAHHRYQWSHRGNTCWTPQDQWKSRFIE